MRAYFPNPPTPAFIDDLRSSVGEACEIATGEPPQDYEVLINGRPTAGHLGAASLRAVLIPFAGPSSDTIALLRSRPGLTVCNLHHNAPDTAELAVALLLAAAKEIVPMDRKMRSLDWTPRYLPTSVVSLEGKRALILGFGNIGKRIGRALRALGMDVRAVRRRADEEYVEEDVSVHPLASLDCLLREADALIIALPATDDTIGLIGPKQLEALPRGAILVNIARGRIVDEEALFLALQSGRLHSAGLDVWYAYPQGTEGYFEIPESASNTAPSRFPFETLDNVVMSPHRGGITLDTEARRLRDLTAILTAFARGEEPPNRMDLDAGY